MVGLLARLGRHRDEAAQALLFGSAAGVVFALQAGAKPPLAAEPIPGTSHAPVAPPPASG